VVPLTSDACAQIKPGSSKLTPLPGQICAQPRPSIGTKPPTYPFASSILSKSRPPAEHRVPPKDTTRSARRYPAAPPVKGLIRRFAGGGNSDFVVKATSSKRVLLTLRHPLTAPGAPAAPRLSCRRRDNRARRRPARPAQAT